MVQCLDSQPMMRMMSELLLSLFYSNCLSIHSLTSFFTENCKLSQSYIYLVHIECKVVAKIGLTQLTHSKEDAFCASTYIREATSFARLKT
jgi:hypothetical protein